MTPTSSSAWSRTRFVFGRRDIRIPVAAFAFWALATEPPPARAQESVRTPTGNDETSAAETWYGGPMVATDLVAAGLVTGGLVGASYGHPKLGGDIALAGLGLYALGGPFVHLYEGRAPTAVTSLALRGILPLGGMVGGFLVGAVACARCKTDGAQLVVGAVGAVIGFGTGMLVAAVADNVFWAHKPVSNRRLAFSLVPTYQMETRQTAFLFQGTW